jgi:tetratricopeptide (TPR) repeat protein
VARPQSSAKLARVLTSIARGRRTGTLEVTSDEVTTLLFFAKGRLVFAEQGTLGETLGRRLLRDGKLTQDQYAAVIQKMTSALIESEQMRFGEVVVSLGYLDAEVVHQALQDQVRRKLLLCFQWSRVRLGWDPSPEPLRAVAHFPSEVLPIVVQGILAYWTRVQLLPTLGPHRSRYPILARTAAETSRQLALPSAESGFLRAIDGRRSIDELREREGLDPLGRERLLVALILTGAVRVSGQPLDPSSPPPPSGSHGQPRAAVQRLAAQLAGARRRVDRASLAPPMDERRSALEAEQAHQRGLMQMGYDAWPLAAREFRRAAELQPETAEYELYALWAEFRASPPESDAETRAVRKALDELTRRVRRRDRDHAFAWHVRGQLAMLEGDERAALKFFSQAYRLNRSDGEAERFIRLLKGRAKKQK